MHREYHKWYSPSLGREMELLVFGHGGARVLVFPTSMGRFFEWEDRGMPGAIGDWIDNGWFQLTCVDSVDEESWYNKGVHPAVRAARHAQYDRYIADEVLPYTAWRNPNPYVIATGASFGAYHAVAFAFRHPWQVQRVLAMSGMYDIRDFTGGWSNDDVYFANPFEFVVHEQDPGRLDALRRLDLIFTIGRDDPAYGHNEEFTRRLWSKNIWHALRVWNGWYHDWPFWQQQIRMYLRGHD